MHGPTMLERRESPYDVLVATILSQRTRDETTEWVFRDVKARWPDAASLAAADEDELDAVIHSIGFHRAKARGLISMAQVLEGEHDGQVPSGMDDLLELPMVGRKTANCVLVYGFAEPAIPVDTHVHRISNRLGWVETRSPEETERALADILPKEHWLEINQLMVRHGKRVCNPQRPRCGECQVRSHCARVGVD
ncbi:MAG: endonuclease III [Thermoplasmata archaeon]|nr:MAG: endonuclease III [Thermoplasmata archaeon]